ncbi:MAG: hypothetical protein ACOZBL_02455 [Patescibacteria group bacterium]
MIFSYPSCQQAHFTSLHKLSLIVTVTQRFSNVFLKRWILLPELSFRLIAGFSLYAMRLTCAVCHVRRFASCSAYSFLSVSQSIIIYS